MGKCWKLLFLIFLFSLIIWRHSHTQFKKIKNKNNDKIEASIFYFFVFFNCFNWVWDCRQIIKKTKKIKASIFQLFLIECGTVAK